MSCGGVKLVRKTFGWVGTAALVAFENEAFADESERSSLDSGCFDGRLSDVQLNAFK